LTLKVPLDAERAKGHVVFVPHRIEVNTNKGWIAHAT
jgi:hypothetical protein